MPMIRISGLEDTVIYEGPGDVKFSPDPSGPEGRGAVLRMEQGSYHRDVDLTYLLRNTPHFWNVEYDVPSVEAWNENPVSVEAPRAVSWELSIDIPPGAALALRDLIGGPAGVEWNRVLGHFHEPHTAPPPHVTEVPPVDPRTVEELRAYGQRRSEQLRQRRIEGYQREVARQQTEAERWEASRTPVQLEQWRPSESHLAQMRNIQEAAESAREVYERVIHSTEETRRQLMGEPPDWAAAYQRNEEAIDSARSEFLPDPHNYTTPRANAMSWSPPKDGEKVARCP